MKRITTILLIAGIAFFSLFFFVEKSFASPAYLLGRVALQSNSTGSFYQGVYYYGTGCDSGDGNPGPGEGYGSPNFNVSWKYTWDTNWQATINSGNSFSNCYGGEFLPRPRFTFEDTPIGATFDGNPININIAMGDPGIYITRYEEGISNGPGSVVYGEQHFF